MHTELTKCTRWTVSRALCLASWRIDACLLQRATSTSITAFQYRLSSSKSTPSKEAPPDLQQRIKDIPIERYRNFSIVAHVDHGKSTLSDRLLELTGVISQGDNNKQVLDKLDVERERGITVKAQTCTMIYNNPKDKKDYLLHLVDTPGHVDFRQEVSRSYASCGGALLLVDASQGIQAQTVANFFLAYSMGLELVPVINKIDLPHADSARVKRQIQDTFELDGERALEISAKSNLNIDQILPAVVERIPAPKNCRLDGSFRALLVDSWFDNFLGVVLLVYVVDGSIKRGQRVVSYHTGLSYDLRDVGIMYPDRTSTTTLSAGQVGYIVPGMKKSQEAHVGDTFGLVNTAFEPLPGFEEAKPMVFVGAFPAEGADFEKLEESIEHLTLNDRSVTLTRESSNALGQGWRLGFLGTLHASVFRERLEKEHGGNLIITAPTVPYRIVWRDGTATVVTNPDDFPGVNDSQKVTDLQEPYVEATMTMPPDYIGSVVKLCEANRGEQVDISYLAEGTQAVVKYLLPLPQLIDDFFGKLKSATKGYATLDYEDAGYRSSKITKLELLVNGKGIDALAQVMHRSQVETRGREWVQKFKKYLNYQLFEVIIQARAGNKIIARETIKAKRKDVLAKLHASDISRRQKLLKNQKKGKRQMQSIGRVAIPQEAYQGFLSRH